MPPLTSKQRQVLDFIVAQQARGRSPTLREISEAMGCPHASGIVTHLEALKRKGYLTWNKRLARSITVLDTGRVDLLWGNGIASFPIGA